MAKQQVSCMWHCRGVLLSRFIDQQPSAEDPYGHVAYILTNVTRLKQGQVMTELLCCHQAAHIRQLAG
jgi:hypothetical protein